MTTPLTVALTNLRDAADTALTTGELNRLLPAWQAFTAAATVRPPRPPSPKDCPGCGRRVGIRKDGGLYRHRTGVDGIYGPYCDGGQT